MKKQLLESLKKATGKETYKIADKKPNSAIGELTASIDTDNLTLVIAKHKIGENDIEDVVGWVTKSGAVYIVKNVEGQLFDFLKQINTKQNKEKEMKEEVKTEKTVEEKKETIVEDTKEEVGELKDLQVKVEKAKKLREEVDNKLKELEALVEDTETEDGPSPVTQWDRENLSPDEVRLKELKYNLFYDLKVYKPMYEEEIAEIESRLVSKETAA